MSLSHPWFVASQDVDHAIEALEQAKRADRRQSTYQASSLRLRPEGSFHSALANVLSEVGGYGAESYRSASSFSHAAYDVSVFTARSPGTESDLREAISEGEQLLDRLERAIGATQADVSSLTSTRQRVESEDPDLGQSVSYARKNLQRYERWKHRLDHALEQARAALSPDAGSSPSTFPSYSLPFSTSVQDLYSAPQREAHTEVYSRPSSTKELDPYSARVEDRTYRFYASRKTTYDREGASTLNLDARPKLPLGEWEIEPMYSNPVTTPSDTEYNWSSGSSDPASTSRSFSSTTLGTQPTLPLDSIQDDFEDMRYGELE